MRKVLTILFLLLIGVNVVFAQTQKDLQIEFTEIDSLEYLKFKSEYSNPIRIDTTKRTDSFSLVVNDKIESFNDFDNSDRYYYQGFLPPLNSYALNHCSMYTCRNFLLNRKTGERQFLYTPYDNECEIPVLSKDLRSMLVFASDVFNKGSFISIYRINESTGSLDYETFGSWMTGKWKIYETIWINDRSIALKTFDEYGGRSGSEPLNLKYYKGVFK